MPRFVPGLVPEADQSADSDRRVWPNESGAEADLDVEVPAFPLVSARRVASSSPSQLAPRTKRPPSARRSSSDRPSSAMQPVPPAADPFYPSVEETPWLDEALDEEIITAARRSHPRRDGNNPDNSRITRPRAQSTLGTPARTDDSQSKSRKKGPQADRAGNNSAKKGASARVPPPGLLFEVGGVLCLALGALLFWNAVHSAPEGWLPRVMIFALRWMFGIGALVVPLLLMVLGAVLVGQRHRANLRAFGRGVSIALLVLLTGVHLNVPAGDEFGRHALLSHGGAIGGALAWALRRAVGEAGAVIALIAFSLVSLLFLTEISLTELGGQATQWIGDKASDLRHSARETGDAWRAELADDFDQVPDEDEETSPRRKKRSSRRDESTLHSSPLIVPSLIVPSLVARSLPEVLREEAAAQTANAQTQAAGRRSPFLAIEEIVPPEELEAQSAEAAIAESVEAVPSGPRIEILNAPPPVSVVDGFAAENEAGSEAKVLSGEFSPAVTLSSFADEEEMTPNQALEAQALATAGQGIVPRAPRPQRIRRHFGDGPLMPEYFDDAVRALDPPIIPDTSGFEDDIAIDVQAVQDTLQAFKIDARVTDVKRGPVITRYEVQPAPGVRVAAIANLDRDMARSLSAIAVRIEAPVPGKNVVGIEVPNRRVHLVRLRDVLELPEFLSAPSKLSFVLGKDIAGQPKWADLTKMPHMLVAGATNSGKSVCLNTIISSIITRATPEEVKFSLIDPKRVELTLYRDIPHLYHPVVVEPKDAVKVLRGMIIEMDRRYKQFASRGVRNIVSYNSKLEEGEAPLPYIVIVIDELADLMMTAAAEFEKLICRLAQLARATGIHLIVATQRPSVNVITGVIKANIPARVAFAVASQVDSRTILDAVGAERLIGSGDMLFDANNGGKAVRIQGAYLSEEEVNRIVEAVKNHYQDEPHEYGLDLSALDEDEPEDEKPQRSDDRRDDLYDEIKIFIARHQEMSASMIQRKFEIGYPRAARIIDQFERDGVLGPADGPKARKVIGPGRD